MYIRNWSIGARLAIGFGAVLLLLAVVGGIGDWRLQTVEGLIDRMLKVVLVKERLVSEWHGLTHVNGARTIALASGMEGAGRRRMEQQIERASARITQIQKQLEGMPNDSAETTLYAGIASRRSDYRAARGAVFAAMDAGNAETRAKLAETSLEPALDAYLEAIDRLTRHQADAIAALSVEAASQHRTGQLLLRMLSSVALLVGAGLAYWIGISVTRPIRRAVGIAQTVAAGDLSSNIAVHSSDETGQLLLALKDMNDGLAGIVHQVRNGTDTIAAASSQIATGSQDLAARTEHQAGSLEETATAMGELVAAVKRNADNSLEASRLAVTAAETAGAGGAVMSEVVEIMGSISGSSRKIVDIIAVIDGIAFQTNILALNAAVEAARAGEQGRGFAVVASEVRNLAQRSAAAAKEIKMLIGDSVRQVDAGSQLVEQAGATMDKIVSGIHQVTDIMGAITHASREQSGGVEQLNQSIADMDRTTQQNASLVEESAAAAASLHDQADRLGLLVGVFRLHEGQGVAPATITRLVPGAAEAVPAPAPARIARVA
ncbi:methyl-accepting chemotaxis protein [Pseudoduganella sp. LjRoot289]|uniref:methyl-accepting chemotaxis protein n=1 Tax=Pseudoduganella sp. LjRoot289 TaxID=3342314 RepID=UPI003ECFED28